MHPFHFGPPAAPLAGLFDPARPPRRHRPVLLLQPGGWEYLRAYRSMRQLALRLSALGCDVLRFDYAGTGDSWGEHGPRAPQAWLDDVAQATEELEALAGEMTAAVVGLRFGARLALEAAARGLVSPDRLVLWDPVPSRGPFDLGVTGRAADDGLALHVAMTGAFTTGDDPAVADVLGASGTAIFLSAGMELPDDLAPAARRATTADVPPCWREEQTWGAGALPVPMLEAIAAWCAA